jgi:hypothetical protein
MKKVLPVAALMDGWRDGLPSTHCAARVFQPGSPPTGERALMFPTREDRRGARIFQKFLKESAREDG